MNDWKQTSAEVPDADTTVIGWHDLWDEPEKCYLDGEDWRFQDNLTCNPAPSHWQHLPEPPTK